MPPHKRYCPKMLRREILKPLNPPAKGIPKSLDDLLGIAKRIPRENGSRRKKKATRATAPGGGLGIFPRRVCGLPIPGAHRAHRLPRVWRVCVMRVCACACDVCIAGSPHPRRVARVCIAGSPWRVACACDARVCAALPILAWRAC
jgi:hypothetical protein